MEATKENGVEVTAGSGSATTTVTAGSRTTVKKTTVTKEEKVTVPTTTTKVKIDTTKMKDLCKNLEGTLLQMVDDTREDDLFITRLQEEFLKEDEKWEAKVSNIKNDFLTSKKDMFEDTKKKEVDDLKDKIENLREQLTESDKQNEMLRFDLRTKEEEIERLKEEIAKMKEQMDNEDEWRDKIKMQLDEIQLVKDNTNKERLETMSKVSDEIIKYRNKRVPDIGELKDLHELVDRIHHCMGYLVVLGQQTPVTNDKLLNDSAAPPKAAPATSTTPTTTPAKKKNKVSLKKKKEEAAAKEDSLTEAPPVTNGDTAL